MSESENSRLIGELIGEMRGMRKGFEHLSNVVEASIQATHQRFQGVEADVRGMKEAKLTALAHVKGGAWVAVGMIVLMVNGAYDFTSMVLGALRGIKL